MSEPFIGEIKPFAFDFAPRGWALCNGQLLPINQNQALFSLLGTMYGGNGQTTFALPNLQGRTPMHFTSTYTHGASVGSNQAVVTQNQMPQHLHQLVVTTAAASQPSPQNNLLAAPESQLLYAAASPTVAMANALAPAGQGQPFDNHQPYLVINYCIALQGIFPSRN
jgi:microcystin-dependent protein